MATKKTAKTEALAAASAAPVPAPRRTRSTSATHSRKAASAAKETVALASPDVSAQMPESRVEHDSIAKLAYFYWLERGGQGGSAAEDWLRAETELRRATVDAVR
jgi:DUF2934 family protein